MMDMCFKNGRPDMLARMSKVSTAAVKHVMVLVNRVWVTVEGEGIVATMIKPREGGF
jgi:hypothetical protein